jgi:hypothetical protein
MQTHTFSNILSNYTLFVSSATTALGPLATYSANDGGLTEK